MSNEEHNIQVACVRWFAYQYPELQGLLFAVPNGGRRDAVTGAKLKAEGVITGVGVALLTGLPVFAYATIHELPLLKTGASLYTVLISGLIAVILSGMGARSGEKAA